LLILVRQNQLSITHKIISTKGDKECLVQGFLVCLVQRFVVFDVGVLLSHMVLRMFRLIWGHSFVEI